jgi:hypothetical protein
MSVQEVKSGTAERAAAFKTAHRCTRVHSLVVKCAGPGEVFSPRRQTYNAAFTDRAEHLASKQKTVQGRSLFSELCLIRLQRTRRSCATGDKPSSQCLRRQGSSWPRGRLGDGGRELEIRSDERTSIIADCSIRERQRRFTATIQGADLGKPMVIAGFTLKSFIPTPAIPPFQTHPSSLPDISASST